MRIPNHKKARAESQKLPDAETVRPYWAHREHVFNKAFVARLFADFAVSMAAEGNFNPDEV